jgi:hypothetical protein
MTFGLEIAQVMLSHLIQGMFTRKHGSTNESVRIARRVTTGLPGLISSPEELAAAYALLAIKPSICEEVQSIFIFREHVDQLGGKRIAQC